MKRILLVACLLAGFGFASIAQIRSIPSEVTEAFKAKYPNADKVEWHDKITVFSATFVEDSIQYEARFSSKGDWQSTEHAIDVEEVPEEVMNGFHKSKYADRTIDFATYIDLPGNTVHYRLLAVKSELQKKNLLFSESGRLLKDNLTL